MTLPVLALWKWIVAALAAFLVGVSKTGIAGIGIVSVSLFPLVWPGKEAVGIALIVLICADCVAVTAYPPKNVRWDIWRSVFPWAMLGVFGGAEIVKHLTDEKAIKRLIGAILLGIVLLQFYLRERARREKLAQVAQTTTDVPDAPDMPDTPVEVVPPFYLTALAGIVAGVATMIANAAGPVMILYLLPRKLPKLAFIGTTAWFFFALNLFKVPFSWNAGMMHASSPIVAACLLPAAVVGGLVGKWLLHRIAQNTFELSALILTAVASVRLLLS